MEKEIEKTKEKITKSDISEEEKTRMLKLLDELANKNRAYIDNEVETSSSPSYNYDLVWIPVIIGQAILLSALVYAYWCDWKKSSKKRRYK